MKKSKLEMCVAGRITSERFRQLENWSDGAFRKRSEVVSLVMDRVLEILEQGGGKPEAVEEFVRRLHVDPPA